MKKYKLGVKKMVVRVELVETIPVSGGYGLLSGFGDSSVAHIPVLFSARMQKVADALKIKFDASKPHLNEMLEFMADICCEKANVEKLPRGLNVTTGKYPEVAKADSILSQLQELINISNGKISSFDDLRAKLNSMISSNVLPVDVATTIKVWLSNESNKNALKYGTKDFF